MRIKPGVQLNGVHYTLIYAAIIYDFARRYAGYGEGTITSGLEGSHSEHSLHYSGRAVDVRTNDLPGGPLGQVAQELAQWLRAALAFWMPVGQWTVLMEDDHIHISNIAGTV